MTVNIFVGNLPFSASADDVRRLFAAHGPVRDVRLVADRFSGTPRGFGFVEMADADAREAITALNGAVFCGRELRVDEATSPAR